MTVDPTAHDDQAVAEAAAILDESQHAAAAAAAAADTDDAAGDDGTVQVDPLVLAGNLLIEAIEAVNKGNGNDRRLAQQIALGHALAAHSQASAARMHAQVAQQQLALMLEARRLAAGRQGGPAASLVVPTVHLGKGRG